VTTLTGGPLGGMVPAGDHLFISANGSANTLVWNAATNQVLGSYPLVLGGSPSAIAGSGNALVASDVAGTMDWVPFTIASSEALAVPAGHAPAGSRFGISAAPNTLLASVGNQYTVWDVEAQHAVATFTAARADNELPTFSALDPHARRVALGYADGTVEVRDARTGAVTVEKPHLVTGNAVVSFAGDALVVSTDSVTEPAKLLVVSPSGSVRQLWHASADRRISAFATSGESVAAGLDDGRLLEWDSVRDGTRRELDLGAIPAWRIAFADTGKRLVVGDGGGRLHVVDGSGAALRQTRDPITTDHGPVLQVGFSDANRVIAVSPILVSYADLATGNMLAANVAPTYWSSLVTVPHSFITVDPTGALQRWRLDPQFLLSKLCPQVKTEDDSAELGSYLGGATASTACPAAS
jgi:WD40 repeat protein